MIRVLSLKYMIDMNEYGLNSENQWVWGKKLSGVEWSEVEWSGVMECSEISVTSRKNLNKVHF